MNTFFKVLDNELGGLKPFCSVRWSSLRQDEVIWNYDVVKPRLTQHLHRALLQPSNVQEVPRYSSIEQPTRRVEEEDGERSLEARLFWIYCVLLVSVEYVSIFQDVRWCPKIPNWDHIVTVKSQDFTVGQFWIELTRPSTILDIYESKCLQKANTCAACLRNTLPVFYMRLKLQWPQTSHLS